MSIQDKLLRKIKWLVIFFIIALALSGITAFPVYSELKWLQDTGWMNTDSFPGNWLNKVYEGVKNTYADYPFLFYGYDWLAFAHLVIAALFFGVYKKPCKK